MEMYFLSICFLLFAAVLHVHPSNTKITPKPWQYNTRKVNTLPGDHQNCFCYPDGQLPTVLKLLDSQNIDQERVVIYLYKNGATNEIKMFTPNADKQMLIPDIPYESGDGLVTVTPENVYSLVYNNPNKIKVYNDHIETLLPAVTESLAIGLNTGTIEHIYPNGVNYLNSNNNYNGNEYSFGVGSDGYAVNEPQKGSTKLPQNVMTAQFDKNKLTPEEYWMPNNYPYTNPTDLQLIPLGPEKNPDDPQAFPHNPQIQVDSAEDIPQSSLVLQATPISSQSLQAKPQAFPDNSQEYPGNLQPKPDNTQAILEDSLALAGNPQSSLVLQTTPLNSQSLQPNPQAFLDSSQDYSGNPQTIPGPNIDGLDQHVVYTFQTHQEPNKLPSSSHNIGGSLLSTQYVTFNIWFNEQMKRFQNINLPHDIKTIDSSMLRILVQKTFNENKIYVSADGIITDGNGMKIDATNLELRPLLLGETLNYRILQNAQTEIKLPKKLPYLEGILVTLVSPPKILGIIPLGKTYLPQTSNMSPTFDGLAINGSKMYLNSYGNANDASYSTSIKMPGPTNYYAYSGAGGAPMSNSEKYSKALPVAYSVKNRKPQLSASNYWSSGPYYTVSKLPYPTAKWNPSELSQPLGKRRNISDVKIEHHYEPPLKNRKKVKGRQKPINFKEDISREITRAEPFLKINSSESRRKFSAQSLTGVMKTLLYLLDDLPSRRGLNSTEGVDTADESEGNSDEESPDFRIIGGNAATGSGTPLSNKGRSGFTENA